MIVVVHFVKGVSVVWLSRRDIVVILCTITGGSGGGGAGGSGVPWFMKV